VATSRIQAASKSAVFALIAASRDRYTCAGTFCISKTSQPSMPHILDPCPSFVHLFCNIQRTHRSPNFRPYNCLYLGSHDGNTAHHPDIKRRPRSMMHGRCLWCRVCRAKVCRPGSSSSALLSSRRVKEWTPESPGEGS